MSIVFYLNSKQSIFHVNRMFSAFFSLTNLEIINFRCKFRWFSALSSSIGEERDSGNRLSCCLLLSLCWVTFAALSVASLPRCTPHLSPLQLLSTLSNVDLRSGFAYEFSSWNWLWWWWWRCFPSLVLLPQHCALCAVLSTAVNWNLWCPLCTWPAPSSPAATSLDRSGCIAHTTRVRAVA